MSKRPCHPPDRLRGFTLVEAIIVIAITGIIVAVVAVALRGPAKGYFDSVTRAELTDAADAALRRMTRDVRTALPNSLRATSPASSSCFEFLPTVGGGRYRAFHNSSGGGDILDFSMVDATDSATPKSFDVLGSSGLPSFAGSTPYNVVIYNLGTPGSDAYDNTVAQPNRAAIANTSTAGNIALTALNQFPFESPGKAFSVIPNYSVAYACSGGATGSLMRTTQTISKTPQSCPAAATLSTSVLVNNVDCTQSAFTYTPAASTRNGLLTVTLKLNNGAESVQLYQEIHVNNVP